MTSATAREFFAKDPDSFDRLDPGLRYTSPLEKSCRLRLPR